MDRRNFGFIGYFFIITIAAPVTKSLSYELNITPKRCSIETILTQKHDPPPEKDPVLEKNFP